MKQFTIDSLALHNFKGLRSYEATFSPSGATVTGHNGSGKSTLADAFSWLLRGKDTSDKTETNFSIKTVDQGGDFIPDLEHTVEATFTVTDTETGEVEKVRFRRSYVEEWKTDEATGERTLAGHHVDYFVNDVPGTKTKYEARLAEIIPANILKLLTDPSAFFQQHPDAQRGALVAMVGDVTPEEVAAGRQDFNELLGKLSGDSLDDYRTKIGAQLKRVRDRLDKIPTEIDSTIAATPEAPDFDALEAEKKELDEKIEELDRAAHSIADRRRLQYEEATRIQTEIGKKQRARQSELNQAQMKLDQETNQKNRERRNAQHQVSSLKDAISRKQRDGGRITEKRHKANELRNDADRLDQENKDRRKESERIYNQPYDPAALKCPLFGHTCQDQEACGKGLEAFNDAKAETLARIRKAGQETNAQIQRCWERAQELDSEADREEEAIRQDLETLRGKLADTEAQLAGLPEIPRRTLTLADLPGAEAYEQELADLRRQAEQATADNAGGEPADNTAKKEAQAKRDKILRALGLRDTIDRNNRTVEGLRKETGRLNQEKAELTRLLKTAEDFSQAMSDAVEYKVNSLFTDVKFRMFKQQVDGKKKPDCVALINGVRYPDANTAGKINAGLQVIKAISRHYGLAAPVFVDNTESVGDLEPADGLQLIRLQFQYGAPLTITPD